MPFATTRWSIIAAAGASNEEEAKVAMESLCEDYWFPLYSYVRTKGMRQEDAQDLTQAFFEQFISKGHVIHADKSRGKFRTFLLACMSNFMTNEWKKHQAQKRGGGKTMLSLDYEKAEGLFLESSPDQTPEELFDRNWAQTLVAMAFRNLEREYLKSGRGEIFSNLRDYIVGGGEKMNYRDLAQSLETSEGAVKVAIHRLRKRFGECLRAEVAETISNTENVDEELKYLISLL